MSRPPRKLSATGMYHIMVRGINRQNIFEESNDYDKLLNYLTDLKKQYSFEIYAYCLMSNHIHLFIKENQTGDIVKIMHKLLTKYVGWFNYKYERSGSLIGNRYKSEPVLDDEYYFSLIKYIHRNPLELNKISELNEYEFSSYNAYLNNNRNIVDIDFALEMLSENRSEALIKFKEAHVDDDYLFRISDRTRLSDEDAKKIIQKIMKDKDVHELQILPKAERNRIILDLKNKFRLTSAQIERITGVSRGIISRVINS